jgi:aminopeptidase N
MKKPQIKYLKNYHVPHYLVDRISLAFDLFDDHAIVDSTLSMRRNEEVTGIFPGLFLNGKELELQSISLDNVMLTREDYEIRDEGIVVVPPKSPFVLRIRTKINPRENTSLEGLYMAGDTFLTQCEAEGFRRITYFPDRPDVMSRYKIGRASCRERVS